jgi:hypothetical protein
VHWPCGSKSFFFASAFGSKEQQIVKMGGDEYGSTAAAAKAKVTPHTLVLEHVAPATRLLEKRRQMFEVQESLEAQKQEFQLKEEGFKRREETLKKKDLDLQESLIRFSKFLQENGGVVRTSHDVVCSQNINVHVTNRVTPGSDNPSREYGQRHQSLTSSMVPCNQI